MAKNNYIRLVRMASSILNVFSNEDLEYFNQLPEVIEAKERLANSSMVYFTIHLTDPIRSTLYTRLGLDLSTVSDIPMRWIKGDTSPHIDTGASKFENTYLVYLNDNPGNFIIGESSYPITTNTAYIFNEGLLHKTQNTGSIPRLLLGPMNEFAEPVGAAIYYYLNYTDAYNDGYNDSIHSGVSTNKKIASQQTTILGDTIYGMFSYFDNSGNPDPSGSIPIGSWRIAYCGLVDSDGNPDPSGSIPTGSYQVTTDLSLIANTIASYYVYQFDICFKEGSKVLCKIDSIDTYIPIEDIKQGMLVKTYEKDYIPAHAICQSIINNPGHSKRIANRLYKCSKTNYPEITEDLYITGGHGIMLDRYTNDQAKHVKQKGSLYMLRTFKDSRAEPFTDEGSYTIYNIALENKNKKMNYSIWVNGLLVESTAIANV